jgi:hypothetical protein
MARLQRFERIEISAVSINLTDDGLSAVMTCSSPAPDAPHLQLVMSRNILDRLALLIERERVRIPKPVRLGHQPANPMQFRRFSHAIRPGCSTSP